MCLKDHIYIFEPVYFRNMVQYTLKKNAVLFCVKYGQTQPLGFILTFFKGFLGCFNPILGQIWTNPIVGLKNAIYKFNPTAGFVHI